MKSTAWRGGGIPASGGRQHPFIGGAAGSNGGGGGESGDVWGGVGEGEGGPAATEIGSGSRHRPPTGGRGRRRCRTTAAGRVRLTGDTWRLRGQREATECGASTATRHGVETWPRITVRAV
jgi:hypothetical protein